MYCSCLFSEMFINKISIVSSLPKAHEEETDPTKFIALLNIFPGKISRKHLVQFVTSFGFSCINRNIVETITPVIFNLIHCMVRHYN